MGVFFQYSKPITGCQGHLMQWWDSGTANVKGLENHKVVSDVIGNEGDFPGVPRHSTGRLRKKRTVMTWKVTWLKAASFVRHSL